MTRLDEVVRVGGNGSIVVEPDKTDSSKPLVIQRPIKTANGLDLQTVLDSKATAAQIIGALVYKGVIDCSSNPNYPVGVSGDLYVISVAGKIGGASGVTVEAGDLVLVKTGNAGGTQAAVGTSWDAVQSNIVGALVGANNLSDLANAATARANLGVGAADIPIYNTSAVMVEGKLATVTGVDLNTTDPAVLFTAPAGKSCVVTKVIIRNPSADLTGSGSVLTFEVQITTWATLALPVSKLTSSNFYGVILPGTADYLFDAGITPRRISPGSGLRVSLNDAFGSAETVTIDVFGYLY
jgi:hypothetical protein